MNRAFIGTYLYFLFPCNRLPIPSGNPSSPIKANACAFTSLMLAIQPETCQVAARLGGRKRKLTVGYIFLVVKIVTVRRRHLKMIKTQPEDFPNHAYSVEESQINLKKVDAFRCQRARKQKYI